VTVVHHCGPAVRMVMGASVRGGAGTWAVTRRRSRPAAATAIGASCSWRDRSCLCFMGRAVRHAKDAGR
jgi:hypothetical protein